MKRNARVRAAAMETVGARTTIVALVAAAGAGARLTPASTAGSPACFVAGDPDMPTRGERCAVGDAAAA